MIKKFDIEISSEKRFRNSSNLIKFIKKYGVENNLDINKYDIVYQKNKEWYSKLFFNLL